MQNNLNFLELLKVYLIISIAFLLILPLISIRNEIYFLSKDINELKTKKDVLIQENSNLKIELEKIKFEHKIINPIKIELENEL